MTDPRSSHAADGPDTNADELAHVDDTIIGRAFRWSLLVLIAGGAVAGGAYFYFTRPDDVVIAPPPEVVGPTGVTTTARIPQVKFTDITSSAGIDFVHENGAFGEKLLPETMGGGCAFLDYDSDLDPDILLVNGAFWPHDPRDHSTSPTMALFRNDGAGKFENVTAGSGLDVSFYGTGAAVADYDHDGRVDVFITAVGANHLFHNEGGTFRDVTAAAGVADEPDQWASSTGFFDADGDGDLDLFVCRYVQWSREIDFALNYTLNGRDRAYGPPTNYRGAQPSLYRNNGDGTFANVSESAGILKTNPATGVPMAKALALTFIDLGHDGGMDIFVANDTVQNFLYVNKGDGKFDERGAAAGVAFGPDGSARAAMGVDVAHHRNDDAIAFIVSNFANEMSARFVTQGDPGQFSDDAISEGLGSPTRSALKFGLFFFDYDLDGRLDLLQCNGHLEDRINEVQPSQQYRQPAMLFWNSGPEQSQCFSLVPRDTLGDLPTPIVGRGAAYADIDADGDLDVLLTQAGGSPLLLRNDQALGHHWARIKLVGAAPNLDAIGAWIELSAGGIAQRRQVMPTRSYLSQVELPVTFGLGKADRVDSLRIRWPDGTVREEPPPPIDVLTTIRQTPASQ